MNSTASWRADAITFANSSPIGIYPHGIFINTHNTIYVGDQSNRRIQMWIEGNSTPTTVILDNMTKPYSLFVSSNGYPNSRADKWISKINVNIAEMFVSEHCFALFVDINGTLYCSLTSLHQVIAKSANSEYNMLKIVAGTGCSNSMSVGLSSPCGIFVDMSFGLYVADYANHRIQYFLHTQRNGTTVAGAGAPRTITLLYPTGVVLDGHESLYIVDYGNHRIVRSGSEGFRCVIGCFGPGSAPDQLNNPTSMAFDSFGNIFVVDRNNHRIQKFISIIDSCGEYSYV